MLAAKQCATIDHISGGRFGLNIVAGWNASEIAMFGNEQLPHDDRYAVAEEWIQLIKALWTQEGGFDFGLPEVGTHNARLDFSLIRYRFR